MPMLAFTNYTQYYIPIEFGIVRNIINKSYNFVVGTNFAGV